MCEILHTQSLPALCCLHKQATHLSSIVLQRPHASHLSSPVPVSAQGSSQTGFSFTDGETEAQKSCTASQTC